MRFLSLLRLLFVLGLFIVLSWGAAAQMLKGRVVRVLDLVPDISGWLFTNNALMRLPAYLVLNIVGVDHVSHDLAPGFLRQQMVAYPGGRTRNRKSGF